LVWQDPFLLGRASTQFPLGPAEAHFFEVGRTHFLGSSLGLAFFFVLATTWSLFGVGQDPLLLGPATAWPLLGAGQDPSSLWVQPRLGPF
jgi:hypothetical protein